MYMLLLHSFIPALPAPYFFIIGTLICASFNMSFVPICTVGFIYTFRQWRHCHIGAMFLLLLVRHDHYYPACGVKLITDNLIHDTLAIRKVHTHPFLYVIHMHHLYINMLSTKYGFGLSADLLHKPLIHALRSKSEVGADNPRMVLSTTQTSLHARRSKSEVSAENPRMDCVDLRSHFRCRPWMSIG